MHANQRSLSPPFVALCAATFVALLGLGVGCTDNLIPKGTSTSFYGTYAETTGAPGILELDGLAAPSAANLGGGSSSSAFALTGELRVGGQVIPVSGTYDPDTGIISFSSNDGMYFFSGTVIAGQATGGSFGPNGAGSFVLFQGGTSSTVQTYCGTAVCNSPVGCQDFGGFNVAVSGSVSLLTVYYNGKVAAAAGTATASGVLFNINQQGFILNITGDITGTTIVGAWDTGPGVDAPSGTWNGSTAQCSSAAFR